jgi:hypothetical protein
MSLADNADDVARVADDVTKVGDDWGWKGGKPGEITGAKYWKKRDAIEKMGDTAAAEVRLTALDDKVSKQFAKSKNPYIAGRKYSWIQAQGPYYMMELFNELEQANVPRKWTGKLVSSILESEPQHLLPTYLAKPMEAMNDSTRKLYLKLYPKISNRIDIDAIRDPDDWFKEVVDTTANVAKNLDSMTADQRETFLALLPEWEGSLDELLETARYL